MSSLLKNTNGIKNLWGVYELLNSYEQNTDPDFRAVMFGDGDDFSLEFDGSKLRLLRGSKELKNWNSVSGQNGYQSPIYQDIKNVGPIPEGYYDVPQSAYTEMNALEALLGEFGRGRFPGGLGSWGSKRISLTPSSGNEMYGRSGFTIHGGSKAGSRGCIDLTDQNEDFMRTFRGLGRDLRLRVVYPKRNSEELE